MRKQRPRGSTTREAVVEAALALVDEVGIGALTLRGVAQRVGAPPMSLYTHFSKKEELLDLMYAEIVRLMWVDAGHATWQEELFALCRRVRQVLVQHPHWAPLLSRPTPPPARVPLRERLLELLTRDGMPLTEAFVAVRNASLVALGLTLVEISLRDPEGKSSVAARLEQQKTVNEAQTSDDEEPLSREAIKELPRFDLSDNFDAAIRAFVAGVAASRAPAESRRGAL
jgi:AcrR family transcriptional regulator